MSDPTAAALVTALGIVGAAAVTAIGVVLGLLYRRIAKLEQRDRDTWWWARLIADMYYRYRRADAPDLPPPPQHEGDPT